MTGDQVNDFIHEIEQGATATELASNAQRFIALVSGLDDQARRRIANALLGKNWNALINPPSEG